MVEVVGELGAWRGVRLRGVGESGGGADYSESIAVSKLLIRKMVVEGDRIHRESRNG